MWGNWDSIHLFHSISLMWELYQQQLLTGWQYTVNISMYTQHFKSLTQHPSQLNSNAVCSLTEDTSLSRSQVILKVSLYVHMLSCVNYWNICLKSFQLHPKLNTWALHYVFGDVILGVTVECNMSWHSRKSRDISNNIHNGSVQVKDLGHESEPAWTIAGNWNR